jgi:hypothetical protein
MLAVSGCGTFIGYSVGTGYDRRRSHELVQPTGRDLRPRIGDVLYITVEGDDRRCGYLRGVSENGDTIMVEPCHESSHGRLPGSPEVTGKIALAEVRVIGVAEGSDKGKVTGTVLGVVFDVVGLAVLFAAIDGPGPSAY